LNHTQVASVAKAKAETRTSEAATRDHPHTGTRADTSSKSWALGHLRAKPANL